MTTLLRRNVDFTGALGAVASVEPNASPTRLLSWYHGMNSVYELPDLGTVFVQSVKGAQLAPFLRRRDQDRAFVQLVGRVGGYAFARAPGRDCVLTAGVSPGRFRTLMPRLAEADLCASTGPFAGALARLNEAAAQSQRVSVGDGPVGSQEIVLDEAYYRRGAAQALVADRRAAVAGWVLTLVDLRSAIQPALEGEPRFSVALYHRNVGQAPTLLGQVGQTTGAGALHRRTTVSIDGPWTIQVSGAPTVNVMSADVQAGLLFAVGGVISGLLFLVVLMLGRDRQRALGLVEQKSGELRHQAMHDSLTGLPNRALALDRAEQLLARARRSNAPAAALYVDIDGFDGVNDTFGHGLCDQLLQTIAGRVQNSVREADTTARLGADEFLVLLEESSLGVAPELVAERMLEVLREPYELGEHDTDAITLTASIGIAHGLTGTGAQLLNDAEVAMHVAKAEGKNCYVVFESGMQAAARDRLLLDMDLSAAVSGGQLFLVYQPIVDLTSERLVGVEALLRWRHPTRGVVAPDIFIPRAEHTGLIVPIGSWVLHEACRQASVWHANGHKLAVSVNVSGRQLDRDELIGEVQSALETTGLLPSALTLEITETALMHDAGAAAQRLHALKVLGVRVAIDDFGTGYSSLGYLRQFPVDYLKVDRSFVDGIAGCEEPRVLINTLVRLAKSLNLLTLAEGIEDRDQLDALRRLSCDYGQGYLFGRPLEPEALEEFLEETGAFSLAMSRAA